MCAAYGRRWVGIGVGVIGVWLGSTLKSWGDERIWQGGASTNWNTTDLNWLSGGAAVAFTSGADVRFDDTAATTTVSLSGDISAGSITFDNPAEYVLAGSRLIAATNLVKRGTANGYHRKLTPSWELVG